MKLRPYHAYLELFVGRFDDLSYTHLPCDAPFPGGPLTTRQPAEYSWMSGNPTPLMKIGQSLLCIGSSTQNTTYPKQFTTTTTGPHGSKIATWAHASILTKYIYQLYNNSSRVITILLTKTNFKIYNFNTCSTK